MKVSNLSYSVSRLPAGGGVLLRAACLADSLPREVVLECATEDEAVSEVNAWVTALRERGIDIHALENKSENSVDGETE